jgi:hypothetical protein
MLPSPAQRNRYPRWSTIIRRSWAVLNNQALALANADRHEQALEIFPEAIQSQEICCQRSPKSVILRELLSKMYYNYRQALEATGRWEEASAAALSRRQLWQGNGERLLGVAVELAGIGTAARAPAARSITPEVRQRLDDEVVATLQQVRECGIAQNFKLASDERFRYLHDHEGFNALVAEGNGKQSADHNVTAGGIPSRNIEN